jgi:heat shock protein HtpX
MKRAILFVGTNLAILLSLGVVVRLAGLDQWLGNQGLNLPALLGFAAVFGFGGALVSLAISRWVALRSTGARPIVVPANPTERWLQMTVQRQTQQLGLPMPMLAIYPADEPNAFATGPTRHRALVAVSTGLLDRLAPQEVEAVLAHELAHIANGDMVTLALLQGVLNTFVIAVARGVGLVVDRAVFRTQDGIGPAFLAVSLVCEIALGLLASLIVLAFSRAREYRADAGAAALVGPRNIISALRSIARQPSDDPLPASVRAFGIRGRPGLARLLRTHPTLEQRIDALHALSAASLRTVS